MKKLIALSSAFILAAVSCSAKNTEPEPVRNENGKYVVTVGAFEKDPSIDDTARHPDGIEVQFVDFSDGYNIDIHDEQQLSAMRMELDKRFAKGDVPDILLISSDDVKRLDRLGAFADLGELMDEYDSGIKRDELTDAAIAGLTVDGRIPALIKEYSIVTDIAKTKFVPHEYNNWNADDVMKFYKNMPEGMIYCDYTGDGTGFVGHILQFESLNCIDEVNGTCDFSGKFTELLQFCIDNPAEPNYVKNYDDMTQAEKEQSMRDLMYGTRKDDRLVYSFGYDRIDPQNVYDAFFGQDVTFVGKPSEDGCGAEIYNSGYLYCITEHCANKEAAWQVLSEMLRTNYNRNGYAVLKPGGISIFRKWINDDYDSYVESLEEKNIGESGVVTKEYFDNVMDYYLSVPVNVYVNYDLSWLVWEECLPAVKGERSVEETIKILNDRVGTYLSERT